MKVDDVMRLDIGVVNKYVDTLSLASTETGR